MHFDSPFIFSFLLASTVLAHPAGETLFQHVGRQQPDSENRWAGAVLENGAFNVITGTVVVPIAYGDVASHSTSGLAVWIGMGDDSEGGCGNVIRTGIEIAVTGNEASYTTFFQWHPNDRIPITEVSPGDKVLLGIGVSLDGTYATLVVTRIGGNQPFVKEINASYTPCTTSAEWVVETDSFGGNGIAAPLAHFKQVTFTGALARGPNNEYYTAQNAKAVNMTLPGFDNAVAVASTDGDTVTICRVG